MGTLSGGIGPGTSLPLPAITPPSPGKCILRLRGFRYIKTPEAGCDGDTPGPKHTVTPSPHLAARALPGALRALQYTHEPLRLGSAQWLGAGGGRGDVGVPGAPWRPRPGVSTQEGGEEVPERAGAQTFSVLSSRGEMDAATPSQ